MKAFALFTVVWVAFVLIAHVLLNVVSPAPPTDAPDVNAILVVPCSEIPVVIFTHADGSFNAVTPGVPPSAELISRIKRTKRSQIDLPCLKETLR